MSAEYLTIGHSNHAIGDFLALLAMHGVTALADVRSHPASRRFPQFDKAALTASLAAAGVRYVFLGRELGARPDDPGCYADGRADFARIRASARFAEGMRRLRQGAASFRVCLLCAERDPAECHRAWLVGQALHDEAEAVSHILADGSLESHAALVRRVAGADANSLALFAEDDLLQAAVARQTSRIAWRSDESGEAE